MLDEPGSPTVLAVVLVPVYFVRFGSFLSSRVGCNVARVGNTKATVGEVSPFTTGFKPLARVTQHLTEENASDHVLGAA